MRREREWKNSNDEENLRKRIKRENKMSKYVNLENKCCVYVDVCIYTVYWNADVKRTNK